MIYNVPAQPIDLRRFIEAQSKSSLDVVTELNEGQKRTHWIWFVFPQMRGLGISDHSAYYAIQSMQHAQEFMAHTGLANRLRYHTRLILKHRNKDVESILSMPDNLKFQSSMTLFSLASQRDTLFQQALDVYFDGKKDSQTLEILHQQNQK